MPQNVPVSRSGLDHLFVRGGIGARAHRRALTLAGLTPGRAEWRNFLEVFLLVVGAALLLAGVICFFAFNWNDLGRFQKLGLVASGVVLTFFIALARGFDRMTGKVALLASSVFVGVFLAVFGQIYQTGADAWELFAGWSALIALWVITSRFMGHWLLLWVLTNTALGLYLEQELGHRHILFDSAREDFLLMVILNGLWLVIWEGLRTRGWEWTQPRYFPRLMAAALVAYITTPTISIVAGRSFTDLPDLIPLTAWLLVLGVGAAYYVLKAKDIFMVAVGFVSLIWVADTLIFKAIAQSFDALGLFVIGIILLLEAGGAVYCMVNLERKWKSSGH